MAGKKNRSHFDKISANRKYKDTVFRKLFSDRKNLLSLYNAISGASYTDENAMEIVTLESAVYMGMKNDLAFILDTNLFLFEHQSTNNPNMPLRDLFYISSEYQKLVDRKSIYSSVLLKLPEPNFIVFYNGAAKMPERWVNYLSDAYEKHFSEPNLELKVVTININEGYNKELMEQCRILKEYAQYVKKVREYAEKTTLDSAVQKAVDECIHEGILEKFLRANRAEVIAVSIFEYNKEEEEQKLRKAEYEAGVEAGIKTGIEAGVVEGELKKAKETALSLAEMGLPVDKIAEAVKISRDKVEEWMKE